MAHDLKAQHRTSEDSPVLPGVSLTCHIFKDIKSVTNLAQLTENKVL